MLPKLVKAAALMENYVGIEDEDFFLLRAATFSLNYLGSVFQGEGGEFVRR